MEASLKIILTLMKEAIVLICNCTGRIEILLNSTRYCDDGKIRLSCNS